MFSLFTRCALVLGVTLCVGDSKANSASVERRLGTAILSIFVPGELIAVAADSKTIGVTFGGEEKVLTECKIRRIRDNVFFAAAGPWSLTAIDLATVIAQAFREKQEPQEGAILAEKRVQNYLAEGLSNSRLRSPQNFENWFDKLRHASLIIFGLHKGSLFLYWSEFFATADTNHVRVQVTRQECPGKECPPGKTSITFYGHTKGFDQYTTDNVSQVDMAWIKTAMESAIKAEPEFVGPPIDIIRINNTGAKWLEAKDECK